MDNAKRLGYQDVIMGPLGMVCGIRVHGNGMARVHIGIKDHTTLRSVKFETHEKAADWLRFTLHDGMEL
jgi:hypothetical protein